MVALNDSAVVEQIEGCLRQCDRVPCRGSCRDRLQQATASSDRSPGRSIAWAQLPPGWAGWIDAVTSARRGLSGRLMLAPGNSSMPRGDCLSGPCFTLSNIAAMLVAQRRDNRPFGSISEKPQHEIPHRCDSAVLGSTSPTTR